MSIIYTGLHSTGILLTATTANPVTIASGAYIGSGAKSYAVKGDSTSGQADYKFRWNITNFGEVKASGTGSTGVYLAGGGAVYNGRPGYAGYIGGGKFGVYVKALSGTVVNSGQIVGRNGVGVDLAAGGEVTNLGVIEGTGGVVGITNGAAASLYNYGGIVATGGYSCVNLSATGSNLLVNGRTGSIKGASGGGAAVYAGGPANIVNLGDIAGFSNTGAGIRLGDGGTIVNGRKGTGTGFITSQGDDAIGVFSGGPVTVTNYGVIEPSSASPGAGIFLADGGKVTNFGSIAGGGATFENGNDAIEIQGAGTVANYGTISGYGPVAGVKLQSTGSSRLSNVAGAYIHQKTGPAVEIAYAAGTIVNLGTIIALAGAGVQLDDGGIVTNGQSGSTEGKIDAGTVGIEETGTVNATIANYGTVIGNGSGDGIALADGGRITNSGTIFSRSGSNGIAITGTAAARVVNSGDVYASGGTSQIYLDTSGGAYLHNAGGAHIGGFSDQSTNGVSIAGAAGTVVNLGAISGQTAGVVLAAGGRITTQGMISGTSYGVEVAGGAATIVNDGQINTYSGGGPGIAFLNGAGGTIINDGNISGGSGTAVSFGGGNDLVVDEAHGGFESSSGGIGIVNGGGGTNTLDLFRPGIDTLTGFVGFSIVFLLNGETDGLTITDADFSGLPVGTALTVHGSNTGDTIDAGGLTAGDRLDYFGTSPGFDNVTGGAGNDTFSFTAAALNGNETIAGGGGSDRLLVTTGGTVEIPFVTRIETFRLDATAADTLALVNGNFTGVAGAAITVDAGNSGDTVDASAVTGSNRVIIVGGAGTDILTGGAGNDVFEFSAGDLIPADSLQGGGGADTLEMTSAGTINAGGIAGVETYKLFNGPGNKLSLAGANFSGVTGTTITIEDGSKGNTINAKALTGTSRIIVHAGAGADKLTGGAGNDEFFAAGDTAMTGGAGTNEFIFSALGSNAITDFHASKTNRIVVSNSGFGLDETGAGAVPKPLPTAQFKNGAFNNSVQRFAYSQATGALFFSADGNAASEHLVASLTDHAALSAAQLFFIA